MFHVPNPARNGERPRHGTDSSQKLSPDDMHIALQQTYASLLALQTQGDSHGSVAVATPETPAEAVHWRKSITKHTVTCLECGQSFKQLSARHLVDHRLDGRSYRVKYRIPRTQAVSSQSDHIETEGDCAEVETVGEGSDVSQGAGEGTKGGSAENEEGAEKRDGKSEGIDFFCIPLSQPTLIRSG